MAPLHISSHDAVHELATTDFEISQLMREAIELFSLSLPEDVELTFRQRGAECWVRANLRHLVWAVLTLLLNARDAMRGGGRIVIDTSSVVVSDVEVGLYDEVPAGEYALLKIASTGKEIFPEHIRQIFDPFFSTTPRDWRTDQGLAIVNGAVTKFGGHIRVKSSPHAGTTFCVYLPAISHATVTVEAPGREPCSRQGCPLSGTILVVDDEDSIRSSVRAILEGFGLSVQEASDATEALQKADMLGESLAVLVTDVVMPGMSGTQLAHVLRKKHRTLPLVFMSGYAAGEQGHELFEHATFLQKPFNAATLIHALQRAGRCPNATGSKACATGQ